MRAQFARRICSFPIFLFLRRGKFALFFFERTSTIRFFYSRTDLGSVRLGVDRLGNTDNLLCQGLASG